MANNAYVIASGVQTLVLDMTGNVAPGAQVIYSAVVLDPSNKPVPITPGTVNFNAVNRPVTFGVGHNDSLAAIETAVVADVRALWNDPTINVVFM